MCGHDTVFALDGRTAGEGTGPGDEDDTEDESDGRSGHTARNAEPPTADALLARAAEEDRTLVTRNVRLAERAGTAIPLTERDPIDQLRELHAAGVDLTLAATPTLCGSCNGPLDRVAPEEPTADYAPDARDEAVWRCRDCGQLFWKGGHWDRVAETLEAVRGE
jgi:hypothetical protein